ncbi:glutathione S-transferase family protein [Phreatobacter stygius]|uniref:Glutathione S-transferase family protein n=1 Tax=Phreatobacter stygius TaxID=1940610 RepID=A0A4D7BJZ1_9HYPH|nr:glutathione S-transferase family protein [Phreatobacter stygius]QCI68072.1 glutathione S-transferase family protein [Phreatobacter stygius]
MITLFGGGAQFGLPEVSPYVTKTEVQLKMAGLAYAKDFAMPEASPKGQLPFIADNGALIADSTFIRAHIEKTYGHDFDAGLTPVERAQAWAIERMLENHLGWTACPERYLNPANFAKGPARWFDQAPEPIRAKLREDLKAAVTANLNAVGILRHSPAEIVALGERSLAALSLLLGERDHLMADHPVGVDATAFAMLAQILTPFFDTPLRRRAEAHANLVAYVDRMMARYYPEHPWRQAA